MNGIWLPRGPMDGDIADPDNLADAFAEAAGVASDPTQYQWKSGGFSNVNVVKGSASVQVAFKRRAAQTRTNNLNQAPMVPDDAGADVQIWKIPYNRGWVPVADDNTVAGDLMEISWTAAVPELLWMLMTCSTLRRSTIAGPAGWINYWAADTTRHPRVQVAMEVDGVRVQGSGPFGQPFQGYPRGTADGTKMCGVGTMAVQMVGAGPHTFRMVAANASAIGVNDSGSTPAVADETYTETGPIDGIGVGCRQIILFRFPFGMPAAPG